MRKVSREALAWTLRSPNSKWHAHSESGRMPGLPESAQLLGWGQEGRGDSRDKADVERDTTVTGQAPPTPVPAILDGSLVEHMARGSRSREDSPARWHLSLRLGPGIHSTSAITFRLSRGLRGDPSWCFHMPTWATHVATKKCGYTLVWPLHFLFLITQAMIS